MYFASVILLLLVLPAASVGVEAIRSRDTVSILYLVGRWFVFWAVGVRLIIAGLRQVIQPRFTAEEIFRVHDRGSFAIVREVGFANLSMGTLGICTLFHVSWILPSAIVGGLYYGLAGLGHVPQKNKNGKEYVAMISDGYAFLVLLVVVINDLF
jgi:hypothetical protein